MRRFLRDNGLSIVVMVMFLVLWTGQALSGHAHYNEEQRSRGEPQLTLGKYLLSGHFVSATMENWESEFLQMAVYVVFTIFLYQRGSSESKKIGEREAVNRDPRVSKNRKDAPWPVRRGGLVLVLYENSLSVAFVLLFALSLALHAVGGAMAHNEAQLQHGSAPIGAWEYMRTSRFWFESFQNWQSEFLSLGAMVILSIVLRQRGSPESKPVDAPHSMTGPE